MDFAATLATVESFLSERGYRSALVGGVALAAYGLARTTLDLDFVTELAAQDGLVGFLEEKGYETLHRSRGYSNHLSADPALGRLDFIYVDGETAERIFSTSRTLSGPAGEPTRVVSPENLVAMKLLAMKNDPGRELQDLADLRYLLQLPGLDRESVRQSFARHGRLETYDQLLAGL